MHQKLQFAVTVVNDPELVILDEPFSGLDPVNQDLLREIIAGMRRAGRTVLFSTHVMHEAERLCDFIVPINRGRAVLNGSLDQIRAGHESHTVSVELEGDSGFVGRLPQAKAVKPEGGRIEVGLRGIDRAVLDEVQSVPLRRVELGEEQGQEQEHSEGQRMARMMVPFAFMYLIFIGIVGMGRHMLSSIIEEENSRIIEVLLSAISPFDLMAVGQAPPYILHEN